MLAHNGVFLLVKAAEWKVNPFLVEVSVFFLGLTCILCLFDPWLGFFFLFDVLEFEDNGLLSLLVSTGGAEA